VTWGLTEAESFAKPELVFLDDQRSVDGCFKCLLLGLGWGYNRKLQENLRIKFGDGNGNTKGINSDYLGDGNFGLECGRPG